MTLESETGLITKVSNRNLYDDDGRTLTGVRKGRDGWVCIVVWVSGTLLLREGRSGGVLVELGIISFDPQVSLLLTPLRCTTQLTLVVAASRV